MRACVRASERACKRGYQNIGVKLTHPSHRRLKKNLEIHKMTVLTMVLLGTAAAAPPPLVLHIAINGSDTIAGE